VGRGQPARVHPNREEIVTVDGPKSVDRLCAELGIDARQLAERSGVDEQRVVAIVLGRWTPSPEDRDRIAAVFGLARDQIAWGHKTPIQHIYGQGPA
jgi:transcriptional regulator with XRE-family HTH domain